MSSSLTQEITALMGRYRVNQTQLCRDLGWSKPYLSRRINDELGMPWTLHNLRHWFATSVYAASGNDLRAVQDLLGHASVQTTQVYTAWNRESAKAAVLSIGQVSHPRPTVAP